jgi:serine protease Do
MWAKDLGKVASAPDEDVPCLASIGSTLASRFSMTRSRSLFGSVALAAMVATGALAPPALLLAPSPALAQFAGGASRAPASFADLAEKVKPSVVSIFVSGGPRPTAQRTPQPNQPPQGRGTPRVPDSMPEEYRRFFEEFFGRGGGTPQPMPTLAQGSGFVISEDGFVVTNNHVVENGSRIQITFDNQEKFDADLIGTDPRTDIALLKIKSDKRFPAVKFAAKDPRVGDWVIAVGNPFGFGGTVTAGIVSALARDVGSTLNDFLQIDAAVNRGNSGGPTFNLDGEVVGVNTAIYSPSGGNVGIAFAVPARTVADVVTQLRSSGTVSRGWLGVRIQNLDEDTAQALGLPDAKGAVINEVTANGPAEASGLKTGDAILTVNGDRISNSTDLARKVAGFPPNTTVDVQVLRGGKQETIKVRLGDAKDAGGPQATPAKSEPRPVPGANTELSGLGLSLAAPGSAQAKGVREGAVVASVEPGSDAATKGLRAGDVILEAGGRQVVTAADVQAAVSEAERLGRRAVLLRVKSGETARFVGVQMKK